MSMIIVRGSKPSIEFTGEVDAAMAPNGTLVISEKVPNIKEADGVIPKMVAMFPAGEWEWVDAR